MVTIKFKDPIIEEIPVICKEKIAISIDGEEWNKYDDKGG